MDTQTFQDSDLGSLLLENSKKREIHPLKSFFHLRGISQKQLAKLVGLYQPDLSKMLNYRGLMSTRVENQLFELRDKILSWEEQNNKRFGSE